MDILNSILDNVDQSVIITNPNGKMLFFNKGAIDITKSLNPKPLEVGENILSYVSKERKDIVDEIYTTLQSKKECYKSWAEYTQLNGLTMHLELKYIPVLDSDENISHVSVLARDITSSKIFEKKIKAQATNIESLIQKANAVIVSTDSRGYITNWNDHCANITGFKKNDVYAKKLVDVLFDESVRSAFNDLIDRVLKMESISNYETKIRIKNGRTLTFL